MVDPTFAFLPEERYFWRVVKESEMMMLCRRITGVVPPHDTETFDAQNFHVLIQLEQLPKFLINAGQLLDDSMEQRGELALAIFTRFVELYECVER